MQPEITNLFGFSAETPEAEDVLFGRFECKWIQNKYLRKLVEAPRIPEAVLKNGLLPVNLSLEEHIKGWRRVRKSTAAVEAQLGITDHIAATYHEGLAQLDRLMRLIPYKVGFSPEYAKIIEDFQILKKSGVWDVEGMRIIQMMVAAFNMNNKRMGREGLQIAELYGLLPNEQAGSRSRGKRLSQL